MVRFVEPADGGFFEYGTPIAYRVEASDAEDGPLGDEKLSLQIERRDRFRVADEAAVFPGLGLMRAGTCFSCHRAAEASAGPAYAEIARRYANDATARETLAHKILRGGAGVWSEIPMPPHPQHTADQARLMVDWILSLASRESRSLPRGAAGSVTVDPPTREWGAFSNGVVVLTATATDAGTAEAPPLSAEAPLVLRTRRQMAAAFDSADGATTQHNLETGLVARVRSGGWIAFDHIRLGEITEVRVKARRTSGPHATIEWRAETPDGPLLAQAPVPEATPQDRRGPAIVLAADRSHTTGRGPTTLVFRITGDPETVCEIEWIEFR